MMKNWALALNFALFILGIGFFIKAFTLPSLTERMASASFGVILISIYVYLLIVIPINIELNDKGVIIRRRFNDKYIPYSMIKDTFIYNGVQSDVRYFGSNGFLGYQGIMGSTHYGKYYSYVKNPKQQVFILTEKKNYLISCDCSTLFVQELLKRISKKG